MRKLITILFLIVSMATFGQTTYRIATDGSGDYTTPSSLPTLVAGDSVLFRAGDVWRETYDVTESGTSSNDIVYSRYGTGVNPKILASELAETWTATGTANVWQSATSLNDPRGIGSYNAEVYFLTDDSISWGDFQTYDASFTNLTSEFDWTWNSNTVYVYAATDPDTRYDSIEVPQRTRCVRMLDNNPESYIEWNGIDLLFGIQAGFSCGYPAVRGATDLTFRNSRIGYIGTKGSSFGYGIEAFHSNFLVEDCEFSDCGRRAISFNLYLQRAEGTYRKISDVVVRNNSFKRGYHTTALDIACTNITGDTITDVYFYNNIVDDHEILMQGEDDGSNQLFIQEGGAYFNNFYVWNNVFIHATLRNIIFEGTDTSYCWHNTIIGHNQNISASPYNNVATTGINNLDYRNNILYENLPNNGLDNIALGTWNYQVNYLNLDYNLYWQLYPGNDRDIVNFYDGSNHTYDILQWSTYIANYTSYDQNSPTPIDPYFTNYSGYDFTLSDSSDAIDAATPISVTKTAIGETITIGTTDINGGLRDVTNPDIGAYEYGSSPPTPTPTGTTGIKFGTSPIIFNGIPLKL